MSSERRTVGLIFGVVAVLAVSGLYYFFKIYQPKQMRSGAATEIASWEERYTAARTCLLGAKPASSRASEALAIRELQPDPWDRTTCAKLIGKLSRGVAEDTGLMPVEHAWMSIDRAAAKVATAFASHVDPSGDLPAHRGDAALPAALESLDQARAELRAAAKMDPASGEAEAPLPQAQVIPLRDGASAIKGVDGWLTPSVNGLVGFAHGETGTVRITLAAGGAPKIAHAPVGGVLAPDGTWGAAQLAGQVAVGAVDAKGGMATPTMLAAPELMGLMFAVGSLADGFVAWSTGDLVFAHAAGGAFTVDKPLPFDSMAFSTDARGRGVIAWNTRDGALRGAIVTGGAPAKIIELGSGYPGATCLTSTHAWVGGDTSGGAGQFVSFDGTSATPHVLPGHTLVGCTETAALLHKQDSTHYAVCAEGCRTADFTNTTPSSVATIVHDKVVMIHARDQVIGVWREGAAPVFYALPSAMTPVLAISDGKVIDVLATSGESSTILRLPAS